MHPISKMREMKFKWKLVLVFVSVFVCVMWYYRELNKSPKFSVHITPEEEAVLLKEQLMLMSSQSRRCVYHYPISDQDLPVVYAITPTFTRPVQKAELTRLSQTFRLVPNFHWIVVEDSPKPTLLVKKLLNLSTLNFTHLYAATPTRWKLQLKDPNWKKPRGVSQRNAALEWLRTNLTPKDKGVIYFADDDNTYGIQVFEEMRDTKKVSVWPVGLVGGLMVEKCIVNSTTGHVIDWNSAWHPERPFPLDMAAFAINLQLFLSKPDAKFSFEVDRGYQESEILRHMITREDIEPKAKNCSEIHVWHTRTEAPNLRDEMSLIKAGKPKTNINMEV